jgi:hypothetical protein
MNCMLMICPVRLYRVLSRRDTQHVRRVSLASSLIAGYSHDVMKVADYFADIRVRIPPPLPTHPSVHDHDGHTLFFNFITVCLCP